MTAVSGIYQYSTIVTANMSETCSGREEELPQRGRGSGRIRRQPVVSVDSNADNVSDYMKKRTIAGVKSAYKQRLAILQCGVKQSTLKL